MQTTTRKSNSQPDMAETGTSPVSRSLATAMLERLASWRVWVASTALLVPFALVFFTSSAPFSIAEVENACGMAPPDMRLFTSSDAVVSFLDACGPAGRTTYRNMQLADLFYPAMVGVFLASSLALVTRRLSPSSKNLRWLAAIPLVAAIADYLENALAWLAIAAYPRTIITNEILGFASAAKTIASWAGGLALLTCLTILCARAVRSGADRLRVLPTRQSPSSRYSTRT